MVSLRTSSGHFTDRDCFHLVLWKQNFNEGKHNKQGGVHSTQSKAEKSLGPGSSRDIYPFIYGEGLRWDLREGSKRKEGLRILQFLQYKVTNGSKENSELSSNNLHN